MLNGVGEDARHLLKCEQTFSEKSPSEPYYDLGDFHRSINTHSREAQQWFDRGLIWAYGFNHHESTRCFNAAIALDPDLGMAYWGLAFSLGPHLNKPWDIFGAVEQRSVLQEANGAIVKAMDCAQRLSTTIELRLITAMYARYQQPQASSRELKQWSHDYLVAMRNLHNEYPEDLDIITLLADAILNMQLYYDLPPSRELDSLFNRAFCLPRANQHPGLLHLYIHLVELSETPERGITAANHLRDLVPDAGHLQHMPSHIDLLVGNYRNAIEYNLKAIQADEKYVARNASPSFYSNYRIHDYHALIYSATLVGNFSLAMEYVPRLEASLPESLLREEDMADRLEVFASVRLHVLIRFGCWDDILRLPFPKDTKLFCVANTTMHYARGIAFAAIGNVEEAAKEQKLFRQALANLPSSRMAFPNRCAVILQIGEEMLAGELLYRRGSLSEAFEHLRRAVTLDDALKHNEPWGWMVPTRHALSALLLESGQVVEALKVYSEDLGFVYTVPRGQRHPNNIWALHGMHECLVMLDRKDEAATIAQMLQSAKEDSDIQISRSCFCRRRGREEQLTDRFDTISRHASVPWAASHPIGDSRLTSDLLSRGAIRRASPRD